jgi:hypothetical protein
LSSSSVHRQFIVSSSSLHVNVLQKADRVRRRIGKTSLLRQRLQLPAAKQIRVTHRCNAKLPNAQRPHLDALALSLTLVLIPKYLTLHRRALRRQGFSVLCSKPATRFPRLFSYAHEKADPPGDEANTLNPSLASHVNATRRFESQPDQIVHTNTINWHPLSLPQMQGGLLHTE